MVFDSRSGAMVNDKIRVTVIMVSLQMSYKKYEYWHVPDGLMMLVLATVMCQ